MSVGEAMTNTGYIDSAAAVAAATTRCIINHRCHAFDIHTNTHSRAHTHTIAIVVRRTCRLWPGAAAANEDDGSCRSPSNPASWCLCMCAALYTIDFGKREYTL